MADATRPGLRERKKQHTRETIARVALDLFDRQGFHATTIPQIAEAADVSPRTVSSYFPAKEELVFPDLREALTGLAERLEGRGPGESSIEAVRGWIHDQLPLWEERVEQSRRQRRLLATEESLAAYERGQMLEAERLLVRAIAEDLGASPDELEPRMAAAATLAVFDVLGAEGDAADECDASERLPLEERREEAVRLVDRALLFVAAGIRALQADDAAAA
ncbi:TetR/AcrR family transcriptional regulator [Patulibacter sp. SYSU D01012]|uniref:TetR/AcrR family transcriptional regulator n=1 Tax=Patulibacter sp. SYSU D01012 TaxID=2817381 RepID=UPI001B317692|nr:TetR/AcrR family transcriptional regulator [Patulibacter sp. SYSU D01012]